MVAPRRSVSSRHSSDIAALHQRANVPIAEQLTMFPQYSRATLYRHAKRKITEEPPIDQRKFKKGRPRKFSLRDRGKIIQTLKRLRATEGSFTAPRILEEAGLAGFVTCRTVRRVLNSYGYHYLRSRKKGLLTIKDKRKRVQFCKRVKRLGLGQEFLDRYISFYLDAIGFQFKTNPHGQARGPKAREWRLASEGLDYTCKGSKEGTTNVNFIVVISYQTDVVLCEQFKGTITGEKMENIVRNHFSNSFKKSVSPNVKRFLQDGCPRQNSRVVMRAYAAVGAKVCCIPPRSPDLNPIENFFHLVQQAEDYPQNKRRVCRTRENYYGELSGAKNKQRNQVHEQASKRDHQMRW